MKYTRVFFMMLLFFECQPTRGQAVVALKDSEAPGRGFYNTFNAVRSDGTSELLFRADLGQQFGEGIVRYDGSYLQLALASGDPAPGDLGFFEEFGDFALNTVGTVALIARTSEGSWGIFRLSENAVDVIALRGDKVDEQRSVRYQSQLQYNLR
jgi:hypothetical protein